MGWILYGKVKRFQVKNILVMGAGVYQLPLIQKAKAMGHRVAVVSPVGNYPGLGVADEIIDLDTRDHIGVLEQAKRIGIDAVLTTGTDVAVPTIGYLVDELGLPGTGYKAALRSMDKSLMKQCFAEHGVQTAEFNLVDSFEELNAAAEKIGFPVMVKAVDSSGSRGITQVRVSEELEKAYLEAKSVSKSDCVVVEQYLDGVEIGVDTIISGNQAVEVFLHEKFVTPPPVSAPVGHMMPLRIPEEVEIKTKELLGKAARALGLQNTVANADVMIVDGEPFLIEMSARMGGTCIPEVIGNYTGVDIYEFMLKLALAEQNILPNEYNKQVTVALLLRVNKTGKIKNIFIPNSTKNHPNIVDLVVDVDIDDPVCAFKVGPDRVGHIIVKADSPDEASDLVYKLASSIIFDVQD